MCVIFSYYDNWFKLCFYEYLFSRRVGTHIKKQIVYSIMGDNIMEFHENFVGDVLRVVNKYRDYVYAYAELSRFVQRCPMEDFGWFTEHRNDQNDSRVNNIKSLLLEDGYIHDVFKVATEIRDYDYVSETEPPNIEFMYYAIFNLKNELEFELKNFGQLMGIKCE